MSTGHILGEEAAIFTDMTETMLTALDQQMAFSGQIPSHSNARESKIIPRSTDKIEDQYPDLYQLVTKNYKISNRFYGYTGSVSTDNNPIILVELTGLSYRYGTTIYSVDRVNGTMYGKFSVGYRVIS